MLNFACFRNLVASLVELFTDSVTLLNVKKHFEKLKC